MSLLSDLRLRRSALPAVLVVSLLLTACGSAGGANSIGPGPAPAFTSTPGTAATQGATYTYQIETSPPVNAVALALVTAPSGATLSGNTLAWTPSGAQSRVLNQFSVTATNAAGSTIQSWNVTPAGTVNGTWVITYWTSSGPVLMPFDWSKAETLPRALVPQPDGSFQALQGSGNSDGTFSILDVPGGYYWLQPAAASYWTSSSTFDFGFDTNTQAPSTVTTNTTTTGMHFNLSSLDPLQAEDEVAFLWDVWPPFSLPFFAGSPAGATTYNAGALVTSNIDFSQPGTAFLLQYEPETFGALSALRLGPEATLQGLAFVNGVSNTVNETMVQSPQNSFDLNVKGSAWAPLFTDAGPSTPTVEGADLEITAQAFMAGGNLLSIAGLNIPLLVDLHPSSPPSFELLTAPTEPVCFSSEPLAPGDFTFLPGEPPVTTDKDFGTVQYGDPFPSTWPRVFTFCQTASVPIPLPGSSTSVSFRLVDAVSSSLPTSPIVPPIGQVQNPTINGTSLFVPSSIGSPSAILNWTAPSGTTPPGYRISIFTPGALPGGVQTYLPRGSFYTAKTSALLPLLQAGQTYVFLITAILDGVANFETRPNRSGLPTASVSVVSAPITVSSAP